MKLLIPALICLSAILVYSCGVQKEKPLKDKINLVHVKGISFSYELGDTTVLGENSIIDIMFTVKNHSSQTVKYIQETCNGLELYLIAEPDTYEVWPDITCNATFPEIRILGIDSSMTVRSRLHKPKDSEPIKKIGLDFRTVDKFVPREVLQKWPEIIEDSYRMKTDEFVIYQN